MTKFHEIFENIHTVKLGYFCRVINFIEDILEDSECLDVYVKEDFVDTEILIVNPQRCRYSIEESIELYGDKYGLLNVMVDSYTTGISSRLLYDRLITHYEKTLHNLITRYISTTDQTGIEYFLGVLFDGRGFIVEGEEDKVVLPSIPLCMSAHTHPRGILEPSMHDIKTINRTLIDRGIGHVIVSSSGSLFIYRAKPLTIEDYFLIKRLEDSRDPVQALREMVLANIVKVKKT